jgi:polyribonucleotide nucleotidyltransferase
MNIIKKVITLGDGRTIEIETGKLAKQADGSVVVKMGGTMLLAAVTCAKEAKPDTDFMPLSVDYKEKFAAAGRYPGGFMKREGRPSDYEILVSRLIDRALRPCSPDRFSRRGICKRIPDLGRAKTSCPMPWPDWPLRHALAVSDIPFNGPISASTCGAHRRDLCYQSGFFRTGKKQIWNNGGRYLR